MRHRPGRALAPWLNRRSLSAHWLNVMVGGGFSFSTTRASIALVCGGTAVVFFLPYRCNLFAAHRPNGRTPCFHSRPHQKAQARHRLLWFFVGSSIVCALLLYGKRCVVVAQLVQWLHPSLFSKIVYLGVVTHTRQRLCQLCGHAHDFCAEVHQHGTKRLFNIFGSVQISLALVQFQLCKLLLRFRQLCPLLVQIAVVVPR